MIVFIAQIVLIFENFFYAPKLKKLKGHIALGSSSVLPSVTNLR